MRLDAEQTSALEYALNLVTDEVYLFGSRLDPAKKGGDIDLLVFSKQDSFQLSQQITLRFFEIMRGKNRRGGDGSQPINRRTASLSEPN